ncbi:hypothetical protein SNEBB_011062 [Seison nebaliae]|nr:hypothetical protein SNEBB_011062 [Seison nebaliae]
MASSSSSSLRDYRSHHNENSSCNSSSQKNGSRRFSRNHRNPINDMDMGGRWTHDAFQYKMKDDGHHASSTLPNNRMTYPRRVSKYSNHQTPSEYRFHQSNRRFPSSRFYGGQKGGGSADEDETNFVKEGKELQKRLAIKSYIIVADKTGHDKEEKESSLNEKKTFRKDIEKSKSTDEKTSKLKTIQAMNKSEIDRKRFLNFAEIMVSSITSVKKNEEIFREGKSEHVRKNIELKLQKTEEEDKKKMFAEKKKNREIETLKNEISRMNNSKWSIKKEIERKEERMELYKNFIRTTTEPQIFYLPRKSCGKSEEMKKESNEILQNEHRNYEKKQEERLEKFDEGIKNIEETIERLNKLGVEYFNELLPTKTEEKKVKKDVDKFPESTELEEINEKSNIELADNLVMTINVDGKCDGNNRNDDEDDEDEMEGEYPIKRKRQVHSTIASCSNRKLKKDDSYDDEGSSSDLTDE